MSYLVKQNLKYIRLVLFDDHQIVHTDPIQLFTAHQSYGSSEQNVMEILLDKQKMCALLDGEPVAGIMFTGTALLSSRLSLDQLADKMVTYTQSVCFQWKHMYLCIFPTLQEEKNTIRANLDRSPWIVSPPTLWEPDHSDREQSFLTKHTHVASFSYVTTLFANSVKKETGLEPSEDSVKQKAYKSICSIIKAEYHVRIRSRMAFLYEQFPACAMTTTEELQVHWSPASESETGTIDLRCLNEAEKKS
jgi:hypothetical protein